LVRQRRQTIVFLTLYAEMLSDCAALEFVPALLAFISILPPF
jgi:hypothetical protein